MRQDDMRRGEAAGDVVDRSALGGDRGAYVCAGQRIAWRGRRGRTFSVFDVRVPEDHRGVVPRGQGGEEEVVPLSVWRAEEFRFLGTEVRRRCCEEVGDVRRPEYG
jgi:hypothetical protein